MMQSKRSIQLLICLAILLLLFTTANPALARPDGQEPDQYGQPVGLVAQPMDGMVSPIVKITPDTITGGRDLQVEIELKGSTSERCYGAPGKPVDLFFVIDNSISAGDGTPGTNLHVARWLVQTFVNQMDQGIYRRPIDPRNPVLAHSRVGLVASSQTSQGAEIISKDLTEDLSSVRQWIDALPRGGDTDLANAVDRAQNALKQNGSPNANKVILLLLHDSVVFQPDFIAAVQRVAQGGISVYMISNAVFLHKPETRIEDATANQVAAAGRYLADPNAEEMRRMFVAMADGSPQNIATNIVLMNEWRPGIVQVSSVSEGGFTSDGTVQWQAPALQDDQPIYLSYEGVADFSDVLLGTLATLDNLTRLVYIDCNGYFSSGSYPVSVQVGVAVPEVTDEPVETAAVESPAQITAAPTETAAPLLQVTAVDTPTVIETEVVVAMPTVPPPPPPPPKKHPPFWNTLSPIIDSIMGLFSTGATAAALPVSLEWLLWLFLLLLLLLLLLFLLWLLWRWWKNRRPKTSEPEVTSGPPLPPIKPQEVPPMPDEVPVWITRLGERQSLISSGESASSVDLQDSLIIGVGPVGREVLSSLAEALNGRPSSDGVGKVRLLHLDVQPKSAANSLPMPPGLKPENYVLLRPDYQEVEENLRSKQNQSPHWAWYSGAAPSYERARSRMALFYDLKDGPDGSSLWRAIKRSWVGLSHPTVRIVASTFDDVSSGMLIDLIWIVQQIMEHSVNVQLWLAGPMGREWSSRLIDPSRRLRAEDQITRSMATLRELERFQRNLPVQFNYVRDDSRHDILRKTSIAAVVQTVFVFQPLSAVAANNRAEQQNPEGDTLACMSDCLQALLALQPNQHLNAHISGRRATISDEVNRNGRGAISCVGSYSLRVPGGLLKRAIVWRMLRDLFFEKALGLAPEECLDANNGRYETYLEPLSAVDITDVQTFIQHYTNMLASPSFNGLLRRRIETILNGGDDPETSLVSRRAGLDKAIAWLKELKRQLEAKHSPLAAVKTTEALLKALQDWRGWLRANLLPMLRSEMTDAQKALRDLGEQTARRWVVDSDQEWSVYRQEVRNWQEKPSGQVSNEPLLRLAQRFGWHVVYSQANAAWEVRLLAPASDYLYGKGDDLKAFVLPRDARAMLSGLYQLTLPLAAAAARRSVASLDLSPQGVEDWVRKAEPRLHFNRSAVEHNSTALLVAHDSEPVESLQQMLSANAAVAGNITFYESGDPNAITLLRLVDWVPMDLMDLYDDDAWQSHTVSPALYVWQPEQRAAEVETESGVRLSSQFVSWLAADPELIELFGLGLLYGEVCAENGAWHASGLGSLGAGSALDVLERLMAAPDQAAAADRQALRSAIETRRQAEHNRRFIYFEGIRKSLVDPMIAESNPRNQRDLGYYLTSLLNCELNLG